MDGFGWRAEGAAGQVKGDSVGATGVGGEGLHKEREGGDSFYAILNMAVKVAGFFDYSSVVVLCLFTRYQGD